MEVVQQSPSFVLNATNILYYSNEKFKKAPLPLKIPILFLGILIQLSSCNSESIKEQEAIFDIQGHRGCRGLMPENSIDGFLKALDLGATTLEMDIAISKDGKVVVSHEPYISNSICTTLSGDSLVVEAGELNMYQMTYEEIKNYDCGSLRSNKFPEQQLQKSVKPLLEEVLQKSESAARSSNRQLPYYNIEIKSMSQYDNLYHPKPKEFSELLIHEINKAKIQDRVIIQSFDVRPLRYLSEQYPEIKLAYLTENQLSHIHNLQKLGFELDIYSPQYEYVSQKMINDLHERNISIIPWTINEKDEMIKFIEMGVDGIISDYPDRLIQVVDSLELLQ